MTANGVLALSQSRHPIIEKISSRPFVPNNIYASQFENFHIVTGPNMSGNIFLSFGFFSLFLIIKGKSTLLSQICLITIMAQIGCYVPASFASLRVFDRIFTSMRLFLKIILNVM